VKHPVDELSAFLDGALPEAERGRIEAHLAGCGACRLERDRLAAALALVATLPRPPEPSPAFESRFYARLARVPAPRRTLLDRLSWRWMAPLAGAAAAAGVMVYAGARQRADELFLARHLDLFESYELVASVDAAESAEDLGLVAHLDELDGEGRP